MVSLARIVSVETAQVLRMIWQNSRGFDIIIDDEVVSNIPQGQNMQLAVLEVRSRPSIHVEASHGRCTRAKQRSEAVRFSTRKSYEFRLLF